MAAQTINKVINDTISLTNVKTLDANGNPAQGLTYSLNFVSGDPTGLSLTIAFGVASAIKCLKTGTYQILLTATNSGGSVTTDAAGDADGTADTIVVTEPAPATQTWTYA